jgi:hypothetical protein
MKATTLIVGFSLLLVAADRASAQWLVPPTPANKVSVSVKSTVAFDATTGLYTYDYEITSKRSSAQKVVSFALRLEKRGSPVSSPRGWSFETYLGRPIVEWSATEAVPDPPGVKDDGGFPLAAYSIRPGASAKGFRFVSPDPPGTVTYYVRGEVPFAVVKPGVDPDAMPPFDDDIEVDSVKGQTVGPVQLPDADVRSLREAGIFDTQMKRVTVPELFYRYPVPQALAENARARAMLRAQGADIHDITLGETVGAFVAEDGGYWFGKSFADAEGDTGRGDIGFLRPDGRYVMLHLPQLRRWSVSALLVEKDAIWAGMFHLGEGEDIPHGVLRFDRGTKRVSVYRLPNVVHTLASVGGRIFAGTTDGPYVLRNRVATRLVLRN